LHTTKGSSSSQKDGGSIVNKKERNSWDDDDGRKREMEIHCLEDQVMRDGLLIRRQCIMLNGVRDGAAGFVTLITNYNMLTNCFKFD
jgi:hypothetical protein